MPHIIAIAGASCVGKTSLANALAQRLSAPILPMDAYYRDLTFLPLESRCKFNFDIPDAIDHDLLRQNLTGLTAGKTIERPVYDFTIHTRAPQTQTVAPAPYLILEGLFALHWEDIRPLLSTKVFVDAPDDVCLSRRQFRDVRERGRTLESVLQQYAETVRPMAELYVLPTRRYADLVVSGEIPIADSAALVLAHLQSAASGAAARLS
ncbi:MAG: uridine kinase [Terriglobales bacterium]